MIISIGSFISSYLIKNKYTDPYNKKSIYFYNFLYLFTSFLSYIIVMTDIFNKNA